MYKAVLILLVCLAVQANCDSLFEKVTCPKHKKTSSGEFLNGFFEAAFQLKTDFSKCRGKWRDEYTEEHLRMARNLLKDHNDQEKEVEGIRLISHLVLELTYDFPGCRSEERKVSDALEKLRALHLRSDLPELVEDTHEKLEKLEDDLNVKVLQQKWKDCGRDDGYMHGILADAANSH